MGHLGFHIRFESGGPEFQAHAQQTLLQAAAQAGIELPSSCRNGTCRTCMLRLVSGQVSYRIQWPGLLPEEKVEGMILACIAYPGSDLVLAPSRPGQILPQAS